MDNPPVIYIMHGRHLLDVHLRAVLWKAQHQLILTNTEEAFTSKTAGTDLSLPDLSQGWANAAYRRAARIRLFLLQGQASYNRAVGA